MFTGTLSPVTNGGDWIDAFGLDDADDDTEVDFSAATEIEVIIRDKKTRAQQLNVKLSGGGVSIIETGVFQWTFTASQMGALCGNRTYDVIARITLDGITTDVLIGSLPVIDTKVSSNADY